MLLNYCETSWIGMLENQDQAGVSFGNIFVLARLEQEKLKKLVARIPRVCEAILSEKTHILMNQKILIFPCDL